MRKFILMLLMAVVSNNAMAEWVYYADKINNTDRTTESSTYYDPSSIRKSAGLVRLWALLDFKKAIPNPGYQTNRTQSPSYSSFRVLNEFDCDEGKMRVLQVTVMSGNMGNGDLVSSVENPNRSSDNPDGWKYVEPFTNGASLLKIACSKK
jgi:hypothetical protein